MAAVIPFPLHRLTRAQNSGGSYTHEALQQINAAIQILEHGNEEQKRICWILEDCMRLLSHPEESEPKEEVFASIF